MVLRYSNEQSAQILKDIEAKQGNSWLPRGVYLHTDKKGFKRIFMLSRLQRIFIFFEDPNFSFIGHIFGTFMMIVIVLNLIVFIISSLPTFNAQPSTCSIPACDHDPVLCPDKMVCEPEVESWTSVVETTCVIIFTIEYLARVLIVGIMPPRLSGIMHKKKETKDEMEANSEDLFTIRDPTKSTKDQLFGFIKIVLQNSEKEAEKFHKNAIKATYIGLGGVDIQGDLQKFAQGSLLIDGENNNNKNNRPAHPISHASSSEDVGSDASTIEMTTLNKHHTQSYHHHQANDDVGDVLDRDENEEIIEHLKQSMLQKSIDNPDYDEDGGFTIPGMNIPVWHSADSDLTGTEETKYINNNHRDRLSATITPKASSLCLPDGDKDATPTGLSPEPSSARSSPRGSPRGACSIHHHHGKSNHNHHAATREEEKDAAKSHLKLLDQKAQKMDKSDTYSTSYKIFSYSSRALNVIDLIAILPYYIEIFAQSSGGGFSIIRVLRLARVFRIFKMGKGSSGVRMLWKTIYISMPALSLLAFFIALGVILFGALIYFIEGGDYMVTAEYPAGEYMTKTFWGDYDISRFRSVPASCYWAVVTTTTTGFGDLVPYSVSGKIVAICCAYYGVLLLALPITVIGSNFDKILNAQEGRDNEKFVFQCLVGIAKALDVEYRARSKLAPVPSSAYKMTLIMAIISTFDSTKQQLLKDAILNAHVDQTAEDRIVLEEKIAKKHKLNMEQIKNASALDSPAPDYKFLRAHVDLHESKLINKSIVSHESTPDSSPHHSDDEDEEYVGTDNVSLEINDHSDIDDMSSKSNPWERSSGKEDGAKRITSWTNRTEGTPGNNSPDRHRTSGTSGNNIAASAISGETGTSSKKQGVMGIVWKNMPKIPHRDMEINSKMRTCGMKRGVNAIDELKLAQKALSDALGEWEQLMQQEEEDRDSDEDEDDDNDDDEGFQGNSSGGMFRDSPSTKDIKHLFSTPGSAAGGAQNN